LGRGRRRRRAVATPLALGLTTQFKWQPTPLERTARKAAAAGRRPTPSSEVLFAMGAEPLSASAPTKPRRNDFRNWGAPIAADERQPGLLAPLRHSTNGPYKAFDL
jgi:hypothetical protein